MPDAGLQDRILIRELYGCYALAAATKDETAWIACWAEGAVWKTPHFETSGHPALRESWTATWSNFSNVAAFNEVGEIRVDGDTAAATSSVYEIITLATGGTLKMAGLYRDEFVRTLGKWYFSRREYKLLSQESAAN